MNKQLIIDNPECFQHWLSGGTIWYKIDIWYIGSPEDLSIFDSGRTDTITAVVIDDEYTKFRKALADGDIVQVQTLDGNWMDKSTDFKPTLTYRIKPKPQFSAGDWVVCDMSGKPYKLQEEFNEEFANSSCTLWNPTVAEYCWFWNEFDPIPVIAQFSHAYADGFITNQTKGYSHCEPCLSLPTVLKQS